MCHGGRTLKLVNDERMCDTIFNSDSLRITVLSLISTTVLDSKYSSTSSYDGEIDKIWRGWLGLSFLPTRCCTRKRTRALELVKVVTSRMISVSSDFIALLDTTSGAHQLRAATLRLIVHTS